ncbi:MAG: DUF4012 domain-containing protein [Rhodoglobus sp.]
MSSRRRWITASLVALAVILVFSAVWVGVRGTFAKGELEAAMAEVPTMKSQLLSGDLHGARTTIATVAHHLEETHQLTSDPVWRAAEWFPFLGKNLTAVRELAEVGASLSDNALVPIGGLADSLDPAALKPVDGQLDVKKLADAVPIVQAAAKNISTDLAVVKAIDVQGAVQQVVDAQMKLSSMLTTAAPLANQAADAIAAVPGLLGADGPRNYLVVFQNNAEARSLGGHAGSMALISAIDGKIALVKQGNVHDFPTYASPIVPIPSDALQLWGDGIATNASNITELPRLDLSAETARQFWNLTFGVQADAVIFLDPVALGYLLAATGPVQVPTGDELTSANAAQFLLNGVYLKYPNSVDQDAVLDATTTQTFASIATGSFDPVKLIEAAVQSGKDHRLLVWSFDERERSVLARTPFDLATPATDDKKASFGIYVADNLGSKMTYYMNQSVALGTSQCSAGGSEYRVAFTVTNTVPPGAGADLPDYVAEGAEGAFRILVTLYAPPGSTELSADGNASEYDPIRGTDGDYPAIQVRLVLAPGETKTITFAARAADDLKRDLDAYVTPLATPTPIGPLTFTC